jgi:hypothetical protein
MNIASQSVPCSAASIEPPSEPRKISAVIYLSSNRPLRISDFFVEFHENWPSLSLEKTGREPHRAFFRTGRTSFSLELHHEPVPSAITEPVGNSTLHWPTAAAALSHHVAYIELVASPAQSVLTPACDLTRTAASLLPVTDSLAVCWLNGPALNQAKTFVSTAREMFSTGLYPLTLWTAVRWDTNAHALVTHGLDQFGVPELLLANQPDAAPLMVDYLFQVALSLLNSHHSISEGETVDGPHGRLTIKRGRSSQTGKGILILEPSR